MLLCSPTFNSWLSTHTLSYIFSKMQSRTLRSLSWWPSLTLRRLYHAADHWLRGRAGNWWPTNCPLLHSLFFSSLSSLIFTLFLLSSLNLRYCSGNSSGHWQLNNPKTAVTHEQLTKWRRAKLRKNTDVKSWYQSLVFSTGSSFLYIPLSFPAYILTFFSLEIFTFVCIAVPINILYLMRNPYGMKKAEPGRSVVCHSREERESWCRVDTFGF